MSQSRPTSRVPWIVLALFGALCAWLLPAIDEVQHDDDVLAFLPQQDPDVEVFNGVAARFGMLELVLVGLTAEGQSILTAEHVAKIRATATGLEEAPGVRMVMSFVDLPDPRVTADGLEVAALVPDSVVEEEEIRRRVFGSEDAVGSLVSRDGTAAALLVYLLPERGPGRASARDETLQRIRAVVDERWPGHAHFTGAPFAEREAAQASRRDIEQGSPIVIAVLALASAIMLRSVTAALLNLVVAGIGVGLVMGAHARFDEPLTVVSSTIPVLMVALGGAFGVHVLAGYQRQPGTSAARVRATLAELWRPVVLSGLTTAVALFALLTMDQIPMQRFGLVAGLGVLLLLVLSLAVLPALLRVMPGGWLPTRAQPSLRVLPRPPLWTLALLAMMGVFFSTRLHADPDTDTMFDADSELRTASRFFDEHFGGSDFLQIAVEADLSEPTVLRAIRTVADEARVLAGVVDVRSLLEPIAVLTEALGGRRGIPETPERARRVLTYLADHPAMAQLMTSDRQAALIHVKLAPGTGDEQRAATEAVRTILDRQFPGSALQVVRTSHPTVSRARLDSVRRRIGLLLGRSLSEEQMRPLLAPAAPDGALLSRIESLRDRALDSDDSPVEGVPRAEIESISPSSLIEPRGKALGRLLREALPTLAAKDPDGVGFVAEHLGPWIDEAIGSWRVGQRCAALGLSLAGQKPSEVTCAMVAGTLSELDDDEWGLSGASDAEALRSIPFRIRVTGQPVLGQALARSVTENLLESTFVSLVALTVMLVLSRHLVALAPALWTLVVTGGILGLAQQPISIATSMVACIALGAGVDFGIHLHARAKVVGGPRPGQRAVDELGIVIAISGVTLAAAFSVLLASQMPPLRQFGAGLVVGLLGASLGAIWLLPGLIRGRQRPL